MNAPDVFKGQEYKTVSSLAIEVDTSKIDAARLKIDILIDRVQDLESRILAIHRLLGRDVAA